ncbi:kinase-like protein [Pisolithus marmoratus]|nr:kinase-like protein [Pisolithus marmoratus]
MNWVTFAQSVRMKKRPSSLAVVALVFCFPPFSFDTRAFMLAESAFDRTFDEDDWLSPAPTKLHRTASVGNSWGVTYVGRGFGWSTKDDDHAEDAPSSDPHTLPDESLNSEPVSSSSSTQRSPVVSPVLIVPSTSQQALHTEFEPLTVDPSLSAPQFFASSSVADSPTTFQDASPARSYSPLSTLQSNTSDARRPSTSRSPTLPRPRRRSSQQRVSLIAGRVSIAPIEPHDPLPMPQILHRTGSSTNLLSSVASTRAPSPVHDIVPSTKTISDFFIVGDLGRGAYGLVKRAREYNSDGTLGQSVVIKQIIKSRILADCWKRHRKYGTIPIEIFVMSVISSTSYALPPVRPWNPSRRHHSPPKLGENESWEEGRIVKGHPNICPILDFFEDNHYYYLVLPSTVPDCLPDQPSHPTDLFDLVEAYPEGLPPMHIRTYLGQLADALCFLHSHGIVHRDVKDENVVLGPDGTCVLIDFGSSGLVRKNGWDTFSGTLDYAGPEILRGERYYGKEQDVWAFGVVAYVLVVGECPFLTAAEAQNGLESPFSDASIALDDRCGDEKQTVGEEEDGGGALGDAAALVRACLRVNVQARPTFESILQCRFLSGYDGWGMKNPYGSQQPLSPKPSAFPACVS